MTSTIISSQNAKLTRRDIFADVECALAAGCRIVQYREKNKSREEMIKEAGRVRELCGDHALFIVNDYVDIALAVDADGVRCWSGRPWGCCCPAPSRRQGIRGHSPQPWGGIGCG